jgi:esterase, PHB depolymerase family
MKKKLMIILSSLAMLVSCSVALDDKGNVVKESSGEVLRQCENELSKASELKNKLKYIQTALDNPDLMTARSRYFGTESTVKCEGNKQRIYNIMTALKKDNAEKSGPEYAEKEKQAEKEMEEYVKNYRQILLEYDFYNRILLKKEEKEAYKNIGETLKAFYDYISRSDTFLYYESKAELVKRYKAFSKKEFTNYAEMFKEVKEKALKSTEDNKKLLCEKLKTDFPDMERENFNYMIYNIDFPNSLKLAYFSEKYYDSNSEMLLTICSEITSLNDRIRREKEDDEYYRRRRYNQYNDYNNYNSYNNNRSGFYDDDDYSSSNSSSSSSSRSYKAPSSRHSSGSSSSSSSNSSSSSSSSGSYKAPSSRKSSGGSSSGSSSSYHRPSGRKSRH